MEAPTQLQSLANDRDDVTIAHRTHDGETVIVVDFGRGAEATLDVVGDTAIVVADDEQYEFQVPSGATDIRTNDGMLELRQADAT